MNNYLDEMFPDGPVDPRAVVDEFYPGSKRKRRPVNPKVEARKKYQPSHDWDEDPQVKRLGNGKDVELFPIGALSLALGRPVVTLRLWERRGYIPRAPYRLRSITVNGAKKPGWRMYSRDMIESAVEIFRRWEVLDKPRIEWDQFHDLTIDLVDEWNKIHDQETH